MKSDYMKILFGIAIVMLAMSVHATEQAMDKLTYNDSASYIFSEELISDSHPIKGYPLEYLLWNQNGDSTQKIINEDVIRVYRWCLRGYIANWEIRNDSLFLIEIYYKPMVTAFIETESKDSYPLQKLFPTRSVTNEIYADWYSGIISTVSYQSTYPPFDSEEWKDKRKIFVVKNGQIQNFFYK